MIPENHAMCQRSSVDSACLRRSEVRAFTIPTLVRLEGKRELEGNVSKTKPRASWLMFLFRLALAFALLSAAPFPPPYLLLCNTVHGELPSLCPKYQAPFSFHFFFFTSMSLVSEYTCVCLYVSKNFIVCRKSNQVDVKHVDCQA